MFGDLLNVLYLDIPTVRLDIVLPVLLRHQKCFPLFIVITWGIIL